MRKIVMWPVQEKSAKILWISQAFLCVSFVSICSSRNLIALENDSCKTILDVGDETFRDDEKKSKL